MPLVASDLDRTLIYSPAALQLQMPDAQAPRLLCVEVHEGKPLSFMTEAAAGMLAALGRTALFVPATTRTRKQYRRIHLPGPAPRFAICANGGHLLVDGVSDRDWQRTVSARLARECASLAEVRSHVLAVADPAWLLKERVAEDLFAYVVVERSLLPAGWTEELAAWAGPKGWTVSLQGRKVYAVPKPLTKSAALREVVRRTGAEQVLAAGDSLLDADLLMAAGHAWRPGHGELADEGWTAQHVTALAERGVLAGEEILRRFTATTSMTTASASVPVPASVSMSASVPASASASGAVPVATTTRPQAAGVSAASPDGTAEDPFAPAD
ncbi:HAD family hydrolase [Streptomyces sp. NPDC059175]|uniref:HAD family hydrolase n=1 Tax=Streptomyces sp. NPDC059175 TaxID=3346757 RepID=UPI0036B798B1